MNVEITIAIITGIFSVFLFFIKSMKSDLKTFQTSMTAKITQIDKAVAVMSSTISFLVKEIEELKFRLNESK